MVTFAGEPTAKRCTEAGFRANADYNCSGKWHEMLQCQNLTMAPSKLLQVPRHPNGRCCDAPGAGEPDASVSGVNRGGLLQRWKHVLWLRTTRVVRVNLRVEDRPVLSDYVTGGHR